MIGRRIILVLAVLFLSLCQPLSAQEFAPQPGPMFVEPELPCDPCDVPCPPYVGCEPVFIESEPVLIESAPVFIESPPVVLPVVPAPAVVYPPSAWGAVPAPTPIPGVVPQPATPTGPLEGIAPGGMISPQFGLPAGPEAVSGVGSSISVPVADDQWAWDQLADVVSGYFPIASEQPARRSGDVWTEGHIHTAPQGGATMLEPHRRDSVGLFNRWESTFQTIRRRAVVRVVPDAVGYQVEVIVEKELEDLPHPERATAGAATFRNDGSLPSRRTDEVSRTRSSPRWIALGRDPALEQRMLADIHARLSGVVATPQTPLLP